MPPYIHPTAVVAHSAVIGDNTKVWSLCQIRDHARIGENCILGRNVFVDVHVIIGNNCKIQGNAMIYDGVTLEDGVFIGPAVTFTNDKLPRAINPDGSLKSASDWTVGKILVRYGAAIGANATIVTDTTLGRFCLVGSGSVVTHDVADYALVVGNPARQIGYVCRCANRLQPTEQSVGGSRARYRCPDCGREFELIKGVMQEAS